MDTIIASIENDTISSPQTSGYISAGSRENSQLTDYDGILPCPDSPPILNGKKRKYIDSCECIEEKVSTSKQYNRRVRRSLPFSPITKASTSTFLPFLLTKTETLYQQYFYYEKYLQLPIEFRNWMVEYHYKLHLLESTDGNKRLNLDTMEDNLIIVTDEQNILPQENNQYTKNDEEDSDYTLTTVTSLGEVTLGSQDTYE